MKYNIFRRCRKKSKCQLPIFLAYSIIIIFIVVFIICLSHSSVKHKHLHIHVDNEMRFTEQDAWLIMPRHTSGAVDSRRVKIGRLGWNLDYVSNNCEENVTSNIQENILKILKVGGKFILLLSYNDVTIPVERLKFRRMTWQLYHVGEFRNPFNNVKTDQHEINQGDRYDLRLWKTSVIQKTIQPTETILVAEDEAITSFKFPISLDKRAPPIVLQDQQQILFNRQNIFFHYDAFWAIGVFCDLDLIWSMWVQRLLKEIDSSISFVFDDVITANESIEYRDDRTKSMISGITSWDCNDTADFLTCVISLSRQMLKNGYISHGHYENVLNWIYLLSQNGYKSPPRIRKSNKGGSFKPIHQVLFHSAFKKLNSNSTFLEMCGSSLPQCLWNRKIWKPSRRSEGLPFQKKESLYFKTILLVVVFNHVNHYDSILFLEKLYRPFFANILYCGSDLSEFQRINDKLDLPVSFIEVHEGFKNGEGGYQCVQNAMRMNYDVDGYLHIGDDVLLNVWNLRDLPTEKIWFQYSMRMANLSQTKVPDVWRHEYWYVWSGQGGRIQLTNAMNRLRSLSIVPGIAQHFIALLENNLNGNGEVYYEVSDIFYIPSRLTNKFSYLVDIFSDEQVHLELAIPNIINGLDRQENIIRLIGQYLWYEDRDFYRESFDYSDVFLHPLKHGQCMKKTKCIDFLCQDYLPCLYGND